MIEDCRPTVRTADYRAPTTPSEGGFEIAQGRDFVNETQRDRSRSPRRRPHADDQRRPATLPLRPHLQSPCLAPIFKPPSTGVVERDSQPFGNRGRRSPARSFPPGGLFGPHPRFEQLIDVMKEFSLRFKSQSGRPKWLMRYEFSSCTSR